MSWRLRLLAVCALLVCGVHAIYRGTDVTSAEVVGAFVRFAPAKHADRLVCGGVLITWRHALTAAHCRLRRGTHRAHLGSGHLAVGLAVNVSRVAVHSAFHRAHLTSDVALVTLRAPAKEVLRRRGVRPLRIDWRAARAADVGQRLHAMGFGVTRTRARAAPSPVLRNATVFKLSTQLCVDRWYRAADAAGVLCAQSKRATTVCSGDSGGPIVAYRRSKLRPAEAPRPYLVAIVSAVVCRNAARCCNPGAPVLSMNIEPMKDWISEQVGKYRRW